MGAAEGGPQVAGAGAARRGPSRARALLLAVRSRVIRGLPGTLAERTGARRILHCFGDSHAAVFKRIVRQSLLRGAWIDILMVEGPRRSAWPTRARRRTRWSSSIG
jgi:hypothetical protein